MRRNVACGSCSRPHGSIVTVDTPPAVARMTDSSGSAPGADAPEKAPALRRSPIVLFDLDGTLVDSVIDIAAEGGRLLQARGLPPLSLDEARGYLGDGLRRFIQRAFAARNATVTSDEIALFVARYTAEPVVDSMLYPDVEGVLRELADAGWHMAVCTNKAQVAAESMLDTLGIRRYFVAVCGGDAVSAQKPDPRHLEETLRQAGFVNDRAVMIGDNRADVEAAAALGIPCIFAEWGYSAPSAGHDADRRAAKFCDLPAILTALRDIARQPA